MIRTRACPRCGGALFSPAASLPFQQIYCPKCKTCSHWEIYEAPRINGVALADYFNTEHSRLAREGGLAPKESA